MFLKGSLSTMSVSELLQWIEQNRKSGTLSLEFPKFWKKLYFRDGYIFFASSSREGERLGQFLVRRGTLTDKAVEACLAEKSRSTRKLSEIFVDRGYIAEPELLKRWNELIQEVVYDAFFHEDGDFAFRENQLPDEVLSGFELSPQELAMEGMRRLDEYERDRAGLPDASVVLQRAGVDVERIESVLGRAARELFLLADGLLTADEILDRSQAPRHEAQALLLKLLGGGAVHAGPRQQAAAHTPMPADETEAQLEAKVGPPETVLWPLQSLERSASLAPLDAEEGFVLSRITGRCTVRELLSVSGTGRERTYRLLLSLLRKGYVRSQRPG
jgi:hypothetical protein